MSGQAIVYDPSLCAPHRAEAATDQAGVCSSGLLRMPGELSPWTAERLVALDALLDRGGWDSVALMQQARPGLAQLIEARLGGQWWQRDPGAAALGLPERGLQLIVPAGDEALSLVSRGTREAADVHLRAAVKSLAGPQVVLHAASFSHRRARREWLRLAGARGWSVLTKPLNPWTLLDAASAVHTVDDELGLLALLRGITVHCHGQPFYAGRGLSHDRGPVPARAACTREHLFAAVCLQGIRYRDGCGEPINYDQACARLALRRRVNEYNRGIAVCLGMSWWKRARMNEFLRSPEGLPAHARSSDAALRIARRRGGAIAVWAGREPEDLARKAAAAGVALVRVEDGFVRSVGLGADFLPAASVVLDRSGMHYDPKKPGDLERLLSTHVFTPAERERARRLIALLVARRITKYNVGSARVQLAAPPGRRMLLVPGQVSDDRAVQLGGGVIRHNLDLLRAVRARHPAAYIVYKPHPDVEAGHRRGAIPDDVALRYADQVVRDVHSAALIGAVDEVHTLTSLTGFEALLRGRRVVTYGQPFYAGWCLTEDVQPPPRRGRPLSIEELAAGALILYPRYLDPRSGQPCDAETAILALSQTVSPPRGWATRLRRLQGALRRGISSLGATVVGSECPE